MREIVTTVERLRRLDNDLDFVMQFLTKPGEHFNFIDLTIKQEISKFANTNQPAIIEAMINRYDTIMSRINDQWWDKIYPAHECHFHKSFKDFCNCPFTCLTEILDCLDKILVGN